MPTIDLAPSPEALALVADLPRLVTVNETAERLRITARHVRRLIAVGQIRPLHVGTAFRGRVVIPREEIARILCA